MVLVFSPRGKTELRGLTTAIVPHRTVIMARRGEIIREGLDTSSAEHFDPGVTPLETSFRWTKRFWGTTPEIVMASQDDPESVILGGVLAAHLTRPLVVHEAIVDEMVLSTRLRELGVQRVLVAACQRDSLPSWADRLRCRCELIGREALLKRTAASIGAENVRTIILVRVPEKEQKLGQTAWLAPYVAAVRGAPVALCRSASVEDAEAQVSALTESCRLRPRTVTILADYRSIGTRAVKVPTGADPSKPDGEMEVEPCLPIRFDATAAVGVGRIPFASIEDASILLTRSFVRRRLLAGRAPRVLMVANPELDRRPLPLCEAISLLTAAEYKNFRIATDEFYHRPVDSPEVLQAAKSANVIIYEGHIEDQDLFPSSRSRAHGASSRQAVAARDGEATERRSPNQDPNGDPLALEGAPVVMLQTCDALRKSVLRQVHASGGVAVIGSSTPVHSTSGSAFVKVLSDGLLYRGGTLGEAFRDARNYLFSLQDLKNVRGHTQQGKSQRVALSFRLWGDPELELFPEPPDEPVLAPVTATWEGGSKLVIALPPRRLPEVRNEKYFAEMLPGSEAAGLVARTQGESARRLTPLYFFRLPMPEGLVGQSPVTVRRGDKPTERAVFRRDPLGRFCYVLYYPSGESRRTQVVLRFAAEVRRAPE